MRGVDPDPGRYGAGFAAVYDEWYPGGDEQGIIECITSLVGPGARILELGVGTGRLALPAAAAGFDVVGLDASAEMLSVLESKDHSASVTPVLGDAGDPSTWPPAVRRGGFDCVLAACNLLLNLDSGDRQRACVDAAASLLAANGVMAIELSHIGPPEGSTTSYAMSEAAGDAPVVVATRSDPLTGAVEGEHIELRHDGTSRVYPWRVQPVQPDQVLTWCAAAGLEHIATWSDLTGGTAEDGAPHAVTVHRRH